MPGGVKCIPRSFLDLGAMSNHRTGEKDRPLNTEESLIAKKDSFRTATGKGPIQKRMPRSKQFDYRRRYDKSKGVNSASATEGCSLF